MASEAFSTEIITLQNGEEVELRPLTISRLRKFMRIWNEHMKDVSDKIAADMERPVDEREFSEADMTDAQFDAFVKMCALGLEQQLKGERTEKKFLEYLEDTLDEPTIYKILAATGNLKLGDQSPNPQDPETTTPGDGTN